MSFKRIRSVFIMFGLAAAAVVAFLYVPAGCSHSLSSSHADGGILREATSALEPQPQFAYASTARGQATASMADIAEKTIPSVVNISSTRTIKQRMTPFFNDPFFKHFFGGPFSGIPQQRRERSLGSGVIVSADGIVITNNHVVAHADTIRVTLSDHRELDAKVVGTDPPSDLAVLQLKGKPKNLHPLAFGDSAALRLGDVVLAIGDPFGVGKTVTMGIVSATGRANMGITDYEDFIQTDAAINPGNSGGALVDMRGQLVGINTAILSHTGGYQGIGFAIPSNMARPIMASLLKHGKVIRGFLGVMIQDLTPDLAHAMKISENSGVLISDVTKGSPAAKADLRRGDVVLSINGEKVNTSGQLRNLVASSGAGATVKLQVLRDGKQLTKTVKLAELPSQLARNGKVQEEHGVLGGLTLRGLDPATRHKFDVPDQIRGVVVVTVEGDSRAAAAGLRPGDVIMEINRQPVQSVQQFTRLYKAEANQTLLLVYRNGGTLYLLLRK